MTLFLICCDTFVEVPMTDSEILVTLLYRILTVFQCYTNLSDEMVK